MESSGAYSCDQAAALSGVPRSTVYHWSRIGILTPSVSKERIQLWSYADLLGLRIIYWLRQPKRGERGGHDIPGTSMPSVRQAIGELKRLNAPLWSSERCSVVVDKGGHIFITGPAGLQRPNGQLPIPDMLDVIAPFDSEEGSRGPDLMRPRPNLRIIPGKLAGSPHIEDTRIETCAIGALEEAGCSTDNILMLYPYISRAQIEQSIDLEKQLRANLLRAA